jgi:hypothetical protein
VLIAAIDPTVTLSPQLNPVFSIVFLTGAALLTGFEVWGVTRKAKGDTITEHWRWAHRWLTERFSWFGWGFRIWTGGLLVWTLLHLLAGAN